MEGQVIKTKLESAGIPALLEYDYTSVVLGLGEVRVMVPQSLAQEARQLLNQQAEKPQ